MFGDMEVVPVTSSLLLTLGVLVSAALLVALGVRSLRRRLRR